MGLGKTDFLLTDEQINHINHYIQETAKNRAQTGEGASFTSVKVVFEWASGLGRFVEVFFDGAKNGCEIENPLNDLD